MTLSVTGLGKRFNRDWIFRGLSAEFSTGNTYAILGPNGSGKSTLMQVLTGMVPQSEGQVQYALGSRVIPVEEIFKNIAVAAPYMDVPEEFTLQELIHFHARFKGWEPGPDILDRMELAPARHKALKQFSSGMKQRVKLGLAMFSQAEIVFLDEPTTNFDDRAIEWYWRHLGQIHTKKLVFIATNQEHDYPAGAEVINLASLKMVTNPL